MADVVPRGRTLLLLGLLLAGGLAALPGAHAIEGYDGPGMTGFVPRGDDGADARNLSRGENLTTITITRIPEGVCRLDIEEGLGTHLVWPAPVPPRDVETEPYTHDTANATGHANNTTDQLREDATTDTTYDPRVAKLYAELGTEDTPWRITAHWFRDLKGNCAVETDEDGTTWHDPWGRPFSEIKARTHETVYKIPQGGNATVKATIGNLGTIPTRIGLDTDTLDAGWRVDFHEPVDNITLGPNETREIAMEVHVPPGERRAMRPFAVWWTVHETGEHDRFGVPVEVVAAARPPPRDWVTNGSALEEVARDQAAAAPDPTADDVEESPVPPLFSTLVVAALAVAAARRRREG